MRCRLHAPILLRCNKHVQQRRIMHRAHHMHRTHHMRLIVLSARWGRLRLYPDQSISRTDQWADELRGSGLLSSRMRHVLSRAADPGSRSATGNPPLYCKGRALRPELDPGADPRVGRDDTGLVVCVVPSRESRGLVGRMGPSPFWKIPALCPRTHLFVQGPGPSGPTR